MNGRHPAIDFDARLHIGQVVEIRFPYPGAKNNVQRIRGRILRLGKLTARVEAIERVFDWRPGHVFVLPRFASPLWSEENGMFPYYGATAVSEYKTEAGETIADLPTRFREDEAASQPGVKPDVVSQIMDYEQGEMSDEDIVTFFQQWLGSALAVEHRYIRSLIERLESEGWEVSA
jgi:hypothetical protein